MCYAAAGCLAILILAKYYNVSALETSRQAKPYYMFSHLFCGCLPCTGHCSVCAAADPGGVQVSMDPPPPKEGSRTPTPKIKIK